MAFGVLFLHGLGWDDAYESRIMKFMRWYAWYRPQRLIRILGSSADMANIDSSLVLALRMYKAIQTTVRDSSEHAPPI